MKSKIIILLFAIILMIPIILTNTITYGQELKVKFYFYYVDFNYTKAKYKTKYKRPNIREWWQFILKVQEWDGEWVPGFEFKEGQCGLKIALETIAKKMLEFLKERGVKVWDVMVRGDVVLMWLYNSDFEENKRAVMELSDELVNIYMGVLVSERRGFYHKRAWCEIGWPKENILNATRGVLKIIIAKLPIDPYLPPQLPEFLLPGSLKLREFMDKLPPYVYIGGTNKYGALDLWACLNFAEGKTLEEIIDEVRPLVREFIGWDAPILFSYSKSCSFNRTYDVYKHKGPPIVIHYTPRYGTSMSTSTMNIGKPEIPSQLAVFLAIEGILTLSLITVLILLKRRK